MLDPIDLIPSEDMREALREAGRKFTDMETATLIHNLWLPADRRRKLLQQIADETQDERLKAQIAYSFERDQRLEEWFRTVSEGYVFGVQELDEDDPTEAMDEYFATFELAHEYGLATESPFEVHKWHVLEELPKARTWNASDCGSMLFSADGTTKSTNLWVTGDDESAEASLQFAPWPVGTEKQNWLNYEFFEDRWLDLPNIYDTGDVVRVLGDHASYIDRRYDWAIVETSQKRWHSFQELAREGLAIADAGQADPMRVVPDFSDIQITVEIPCMDGTFMHDHINPMFLERMAEEAPQDSDEAKLRDVAQMAARGQVSLELLSDVLKQSILSAHAS